MKTPSILIVFILFIGSFPVEAQDLMDALKKTAEAHNESRGQNENNSALSPEAEEEYKQQWQDYVKEAQEKYKADLNGLGAYERCYAMMIIYLDQYYKLEKAIEREANCKMKYDLYGSQLLAIEASNTILYCPEKISNLPEEKRNEALSNFLQPYLNKLNYTDIDCYQFSNNSSSIDEMLSNVYAKFFPPQSDLGCYSEGVIEWTNLGEWATWIWQHFHPASTITKVMEIGQKMEALGCGG